MTTRNSICIKCKHLYAARDTCISSKGVKSLISGCEYGGKNAGNRKMCKDFETTTEKVIAERIKCFGEEQ